MDLGIIGYQRSGKTTIFNAVTRGNAATGSYGAGVQPNIGVVKVPDTRLDQLAKLFDPKKFTLADIRYIDFPGEAFSEGHGPPAQFLAQLARCDALIHVVRAFDDETVPHPQGSVDPARDAAAMELELAFADAAFIEKRLERIEASMRAVKAGERDAAERETALLLRLKAGLEADRPLRRAGDERRRAKHARELPVPHRQAPARRPQHRTRAMPRARARSRRSSRRSSAARTRPSRRSAARSSRSWRRCRTTTRRSFAATSASAEPGLDRMIRISYELTGLISFFTVGPDECRAWNVAARRHRARRGGEDPHGPRARLHPRRGGALGRPARRRIDGGGEEARRRCGRRARPTSCRTATA